MKRYVIQLNDDLSCVYEDIARLNQKPVEDCLAIILERVICTMIRQQGLDRPDPDPVREES